MAGINLIPRAWRDRHRGRRALHAFILALIVALGCLLGIRGFLAWQMGRIEAATNRMSDEKIVMDQALVVNKSNFSYLKALRGRIDRMTANQAISVVDAVLTPLDEAMVDGVTLENIIVQFPESSVISGKEMPPIPTRAHLSFRGESRSAGELTTLTNRLQSQKGWYQLNLGKVAPGGQGNSLGFSLDVEVDLTLKRTAVQP